MRGRKLWKGVGLPLALLTATSLIAACSSSSSSGSGSTTSSGGTKVSIALDFIPNADNEGVFVAKKLGYFSQAGIDVNIVPYGQTPPDTLASTGKVQFAIGDTESDVLFDFASGLKITSVMAVLQTNPSFFGTLTSNKTITSPKDFCNQTYGGFGYPGDPSIIAAVIQGAGGPSHCNVPVVTLGSSAYQAVESHKVGFSAFFFSDIIQAEVQQHASLRVFNENNYGVPNQYAALILGNNAWLAANPALAHKFVNALVRAYTYIKNNPAAGRPHRVRDEPDRGQPQRCDQVERGHGEVVPRRAVRADRYPERGDVAGLRDLPLQARSVHRLQRPEADPQPRLGRLHDQQVPVTASAGAAGR